MKKGLAVAMLLCAIAFCGQAAGATTENPQDLLFESLLKADAKGRVRDALSRGGDPNGFVAGGDRPIFAAVLLRRPIAIAELASAGADLDVRDPRVGDTPLLRALELGYDDVVRSLLSAGADPDRGANGITPLIQAITRRLGDQWKYSVVTEILDAGANANTCAPGLASPLWWAVHLRSLSLIDLLLQHGADPNLQCGSARTLPIDALQSSPICEAILDKMLDLGLSVPNLKLELLRLRCGQPP